MMFMVWITIKDIQNVGENKIMATRRIRARTAKSARRKAKGKRTVVSKVNYIKGTTRGGLKTYSVTTHGKKGK